MRWVLPVLITSLFVLSGCDKAPSGAPIDRAAAQRVSDAYMADLVANHIDLALDKMQAEFLQSVGGRTEAEARLRELFNFCGRPLESELRHEEGGLYIYEDGRRVPERAFYYSGKTTDNPKGVCFFAVQVVQGKNAVEVVSFGPLKLQSGQLPDWAR